MSHYDRKLSEIMAMNGVDPASDEAARIKTEFAKTLIGQLLIASDAVDALKADWSKSPASRMLNKFADAILGWLSSKLA